MSKIDISISIYYFYLQNYSLHHALLILNIVITFYLSFEEYYNSNIIILLLMLHLHLQIQ